MLAYRWGVTAITLWIFGLLTGQRFHLSQLQSATSLSLAVAYQWIASSGVASTIHFMYPLAISLAMICFFRERGNGITFLAIGLSIAGAFGITLILTAVTLVSFKRQNA